jgi:thiamine pyrophosphokinase
MDALILADGDAPDRAALDRAWPGWATAVGLVVAADGGARHATRLEVDIDLWVGDGDSLDADGLAALEASGIPMRRADPHKDESDTELAVRAAIARGANGVVIVGGLGGQRFDHSLANVGLLTLPELVGRPAALLDARTRITLIRAPGPYGMPVRRPLDGRIGDLVSLLPYGADVAGITTQGLEYPLVNEVLATGPARGLSNVRLATDASVTVGSGLLLVVESPATLPA